ncbi:MAG: Tfx family DNA-binding protein [Thaumarchaeota archaeon]|nr:Tfx family DNA-binding protein [Nitrososphaerota archaeon]
MVKRGTFQSTSLTSRQWEVIHYRAQGLTQAQVAKKLRTSRENVNEIEHRARLKINAAKATLEALKMPDASGEVLIPSGTSIFEAVSMIILRADVLGVRLQGSADDVLAAIRTNWEAKIRGHRLTMAVKARIGADGYLIIKKTV